MQFGTFLPEWVASPCRSGLRGLIRCAAGCAVLRIADRLVPASRRHPVSAVIQVDAVMSQFSRRSDQAKGYYGRRKNTIRIARQAVEKAGQYAYRDRKVKKRSFRALWIQRINAGVRAEGLTYSQFMHGLKLAGIELDRKVLADIAMHEGEAFTAIIAQAKAALPQAA